MLIPKHLLTELMMNVDLRFGEASSTTESTVLSCLSRDRRWQRQPNCHFPSLELTALAMFSQVTIVTYLEKTKLPVFFGSVTKYPDFK